MAQPSAQKPKERPARSLGALLFVQVWIHLPYCGSVQCACQVVSGFFEVMPGQGYKDKNLDFFGTLCLPESFTRQKSAVAQSWTTYNRVILDREHVGRALQRGGCSRNPVRVGVSKVIGDKGSNWYIDVLKMNVFLCQQKHSPNRGGLTM